MCLELTCRTAGRLLEEMGLSRVLTSRRFVLIFVKIWMSLTTPEVALMELIVARLVMLVSPITPGLVSTGESKFKKEE